MHQSISQHTPIKNACNNGYRRMIAKLAGFLLFMALILAAILLGGDLLAYFNMPSAILVFGGTVALLLLTFGHDGCINALRLTVKGKLNSQNQGSISNWDPVVFFRLAGAYAIAMGSIGMVIGIIAMLSNMDDPSKIGAGMAACLLSQLYGIVLAVPCISLSVIQAMRFPQQTNARSASRFVVPIAGGAVATGTIAALVCFAALQWMFFGQY